MLASPPIIEDIRIYTFSDPDFFLANRRLLLQLRRIQGNVRNISIIYICIYFCWDF